MKTKNAKNSMLCWNPGTDEVAIIPWPAYGRAEGYKMSVLACYTDVKKMNFRERQAIVFIEAMHAIIRDLCEPMAVHKALLELEEYRDGCSADMPLIGNP